MLAFIMVRMSSNFLGGSVILALAAWAASGFIILPSAIVLWMTFISGLSDGPDSEEALREGRRI